MTTHTVSRSRGLCFALAAVASTAFVACGGGSDAAPTGSGVASLSSAPPASDSPADAGTASAGDSSADAPESVEDAAALYNQCMKDAGFDSVITIDGGGDASVGADLDSDVGSDVGTTGDAADFDPEAFDAADKECSKHLDAALGLNDLDPEQQAALADANARFGDCLKEQGIDPKYITDGGITVEDPTAGEAVPTNEEFDAAFDACASVFEDNGTLNDLFPTDADS